MRLGIRLMVLAACVGMVLFSPATAAMAQNVLVNPGFESGPVGGGAAGWTTFGNVYTEAATPCLVPYAGNQLCKMFGNWWGVFNVTGIFQEFATTPGATWKMSAKSRHCSEDPMIGSQVNGGNWVVQKIAFFDATNTEIAGGSAESIILDGSFAMDTWFDNAPILAVAPVGAVKVQGFILYLQPLWDGGSALIDEVSLENLPPSTPVSVSSWGQLKTRYR